ncbi:MAG TPA: glucosaminidase domain-containing protein [Desulfuromonadales bacterium]|nr:glucosaminidase domain-containing protein [Desulfuromonadales bacterium]
MKTRRFPHLIFLLVPLLLVLGSCTENTTAGPAPNPRVVAPATHLELKEFFLSHNYSWKTLKKDGVPPIIVKSLPDDLDNIEKTTEKKRIFFLTLLPMVLMENDHISQEREDLIRLFVLHDNGHRLSPEQNEHITTLAREYHVHGSPLSNLRVRKQLLKRVDVIPPSMVLAQAANESAYGTSRFAQQGNNLFGEWTFTPGKGIVPQNRPTGESYEVRRFSSLYDSVKSYIRNINTNSAYASLRDQRATLRAEGLPLRGMDLVEGLRLYSTRRGEYVKDIRDIIRKNRLSLLTDATLRTP